MTARLGAAGASSLLKPSNEGVDGEGLGKSGAGLTSTAGRRRCRRGSGSSIGSNRGSSRRSSRGSSRGSSGRGGGSSAIAGSGRSRSGGAGATSPQSRTGNVVFNGRGVGVEDDAILVDSVEAGADNTLRSLSSGAGDLKIKLVFVAWLLVLGYFPQC